MKLKPKSTVHNSRALLYKRFTDLETSIASGRVVLYHTVDEKYWQFSAEMCKFIEYTGDRSGIQVIEAGGSYYEPQVYLKFKNIYYVYQINNRVGSWVITRESGSSSSEAIFEYTTQENSFRADESLSQLNIPYPFPSSIQVTSNIGISIALVVIVNESLEYARYNAYYPSPTQEGGTFTIPLVEQGDASDDPTLAQHKNKAIIILSCPSQFIVDSWNIEVSIPNTPAETLDVKFADIGRYQTNKYYLAGSFDYMIRGSIGSSDTQPIKGNIMHLRSFEIKYFDDNIHIDHDDLVVIDGRLYGVEELAYDIKRSPKPYTVYFATLNNIK